MSGQLQIHLFLPNAAVLCGAIVDLLILTKKLQFDINQLELKLKKAKLENKLPKLLF